MNYLTAGRRWTMTSPAAEALIISDLGEVVDTVSEELVDVDQIYAIASLSNLKRAPRPGGSDVLAVARWTPIFEAALKGSAETLPLLLQNIRKSLAQKPRGELDEALRKVRVDCVSRVTRTSYPTFGDQIDALITTSVPQEMTEAARAIRTTTLDIRRLLMRPLMADTFLKLEKALEAFFPDPEWLRMQLADQAVNVVNAIDYLLMLLLMPTVTSTPLALGADPDSDRAQGRSDEERFDWLTRRRLAARGTAVQQSTRLLLALRSDIA